ncbi:hypothetical protein ACPYPG_05110 [Streptomyces sp. FR-108]|uniref:hypothetical protein n=1 Tax=Streptomyces sp. FR-108 TaxID=3416665 RepID=UPI003CEACF1E
MYELGLVPEEPAEEWTYEEIARASERARAEANAPVRITYDEPPLKDCSEHGTGA